MTGNSTNKEAITIIIPLLNEETYIEGCIKVLNERIKRSATEVLFVDGGSKDKSVSVIRALSGFTVLNSKAGRAVQMNMGANAACNSILYFLHIDSVPPVGFDEIIVAAVKKKNRAGCFKMKFDAEHWALKLAGYFTRFNHPFCRGGDQSLFIEKKLFDQMGGFNEDYPICEDNEFTDRLYRNVKFKVLEHELITSARRFKKNGILRLQFLHSLIHFFRFLGVSPKYLHRYYKRFLQ